MWSDQHSWLDQIYTSGTRSAGASPRTPTPHSLAPIMCYVMISAVRVVYCLSLSFLSVSPFVCDSCHSSNHVHDDRQTLATVDTLVSSWSWDLHFSTVFQTKQELPPCFFVSWCFLDPTDTCLEPVVSLDEVFQPHRLCCPRSACTGLISGPNLEVLLKSCCSRSCQVRSGKYQITGKQNF